MPPLTYISAADVRRVLTTEVAVRVAESALDALAVGGVTWSDPRLLKIAPDGTSRRYMAKGCVLDERTAGFRAGSVDRERHDNSPAGDAPTLLTLLCDAETGEFLAIIDEEWQHAVRTGAAAAVAARHCARSGKQVVAVIGAGKVAGPTVEAMRVVFEDAELRVSSRRPESREALARALGPDVRALPIDAAVEGATVVVTATTAKEPVLDINSLAAGVFIYAMGDGQEFTDEVYRRADVMMADDWEQVTGRQDIARLVDDGVIDPASVVSLWESIAGIRPGRLHDQDIVLMRSQGLVIQDIAIARYVYEACTRAGLGVILGRTA